MTLSFVEVELLLTLSTLPLLLTLFVQIYLLRFFYSFKKYRFWSNPLELSLELNTKFNQFGSTVNEYVVEL